MTPAPTAALRYPERDPVRVLRDYIWRESAAAGPDTSAVARVRRGQVTVAVVGVALWLGGLIPAILEWPGAVQWCLVVATVVCLGTLLRAHCDSQILTGVLVVTAVVVLWTTRAHEVGSPLAAAWFDAAAVSTVGHPTLRRALVWVGGIAATSLLSWTLLNATEGIAGGWHSVIAWTVASTSLGLMAAGMAAVVRAGGRRLDDTVASAERLITADEVLKTEATEHAATTRLLHDTVINTLTAIGRGVVDADLAALRLRCQQDLELIDRSLPNEAVDPLSAARSRAAALGLTLSIVGDPEVLRPLAPRTSAALEGALNEALLNVAKHADTAAVVIALDGGEDRVVVTVADSGQGWSGTALVDGGIEESILARCREVGIDATVHSRSGAGTTVSLAVPLTDAEASEKVFIDESRIMTTIVCGVLLVDLGIRTTLTIGVAPVQGALVAFGLLALAMTWTWWRRSTWHDPGLLAPLGLAVVGWPVVVLLPAQQGAVSWVWWGSAAAVATFLALAAMNVSPWWLLLAFAVQLGGRWVAGAGSMTWLLPDGIVIGLGALSALWIRARVLALMAETTDVARDRDAARAQLLADTANRTEALLRLKRATVIGRAPLELIATGTRTGAESEVRSEAAALAPYLRNIARVGPELGELGRTLVGLLDAGLEARSPVTLSIDPKARLPEPAMRRAVSRLFAEVAAALRPLQGATVTLINRGPATQLTVLGPARSLAPVALEELRRAGATVSHAPGDDEDWAEVTWWANPASGGP